MPANLSADYMNAEERWRKATDPEEKIAALQEMLRAIPKHKGTEKMQGDLKKRIAKARDQQENRKGAGKRRPAWVIENQGSGQIMIAGPPNSGKSSLVKCLSNADPLVADYPFSTVMPSPAMLRHENVQIQLVDLPPMHREMSPPWLSDVFRGSDGILLVLDLADDDVLTHTEAAMAFASEKRIYFDFPEPLRDCEVFAGVTELPEEIDYRNVFPTLIVCNKFEDEETSELRLELLRDLWQDAGYPELPFFRISTHSGIGMDTLSSLIWRMLDKIRVFTRPPGKDPDYSQPFVLDRGATALDLAFAIHKDIGATFKYAKAWGHGTFDAQMVGKDHELHDGDVLEVHSD